MRKRHGKPGVSWVFLKTVSKPKLAGKLQPKRPFLNNKNTLTNLTNRVIIVG